MVGSKVRLGVGDAFREPVPLKPGETPTPPSPHNSRPITEKGFGSGWYRPTNTGEEKGEKPKYKPFRPSESGADAAMASLPAKDTQHQTVLEGQFENPGVRLGWGQPTSEGVYNPETGPPTATHSPYDSRKLTQAYNPYDSGAQPTTTYNSYDLDAKATTTTTHQSYHHGAQPTTSYKPYKTRDSE